MDSIRYYFSTEIAFKFALKWGIWARKPTKFDTWIGPQCSHIDSFDLGISSQTSSKAGETTLKKENDKLKYFSKKKVYFSKMFLTERLNAKSLMLRSEWTFNQISYFINNANILNFVFLVQKNYYNHYNT